MTWIFRVVEHKAEDGAHELTDDGGDGRARDLKAREAETRGRRLF